MYKILPYTLKKAAQMGVTVKPSTRKNKKIDVYDKRGNYIVSIGDARYYDFPYFAKIYGPKIAAQKRANYHARHAKDTGTAGKYAKALLW